jgi:hypothetical protein
MPIPAAKKRSQIHFDTERTRDRIEESRFINRMRGRVDLRRRGGWQGVTPDDPPPARALDRRGPRAASVLL